jgi:cysteine desulfurase/selenocysteine lyase
MNPELLRADIPALDDCTYLNTGASGPSPNRVVNAVTEFHERQKHEAPCGEGVYTVGQQTRERVRQTVAEFVDATPAEIALTQNTVEGINHVASGMDWQPGDVIVRTDLEHPAGELPWQRLADRYGVEVREIATEGGRLDLDTLREAVTDARLLCISSISWNYGTRLPISDIVDIAHDADTRVLVDGVQSPGQVPVDVTEWGADFVAGSGHKWLMGLWGAGFLYVDSDVVDDLSPERIGYFSLVGKPGAPEDYSYANAARKFELGTADMGPYVGLEESIDIVESIGMDTIQSRIERLTDRLKEGLDDRLVSPREYESGLVTFEAEDPDGTVERLAEAGIQIRSIPDPHACRVSVHAFNTAEDIDRLLEAL